MKKNNGPVRGDATRHDNKNRSMVAGANKIKNRKPNGTGYQGKSCKKK